MLHESGVLRQAKYDAPSSVIAESSAERMKYRGLMTCPGSLADT